MKTPPPIRYWATSSICIDPDLECLPMDPAKVKWLRLRIRKLGFQNFRPLLAYERSDGVIILLKGRKRLEAAKLEGLDKVPVIIISLSSYKEAREIMLSATCGCSHIDHAAILFYLVHVTFHGWGGDRRSESFKLSADDLIPKMEIKETTIERAALELCVSESTVYRAWKQYYQPLTEEQRQLLREGKLLPCKVVAESKHREENSEKSDQASEEKGEGSLRSKPQKSYERLLQNLGFADTEIPAICRKAKQEKLSVKDYVAGLIKADLAQSKANDEIPNHNGIDNRQQTAPPDNSERSNSKSDGNPTAVEPDAAKHQAGKDAGSEANVAAAKPHPKHEAENASTGNGSAPRKVATSSGYVPKGRPETKDNNAWRDCQMRLLWMMHLKKHPETLHKVLASQYQKLELELLGTSEHARAHSAKAAECKYEKMRTGPPPCVQDLESLSDDERTKAWAEALNEIRLLPDH